MREHAAAVEPIEGEQPAGRQLRPGRAARGRCRCRRASPIKRDVLGLAPVVELFAHALADLLADLAGVDRRIDAAADGEQPLQLLQVGFDRRLHVGILQLAGQHLRRRASARDAPGRASRGRRDDVRSSANFFCQSGPSSAHHPPLDEGPAHRRRFALQLLQFGGVFRRQQIGNGRHQLGDLHQRTFEIAERRRPAPTPRRRGRARRREGADRHNAPPRRRHWRRRAHSVRRGRRSGSFRGRWAWTSLAASAHQSNSNSPIIRSMTPRPPCQKAGSRASRPNGASSSEWCLVPPAESMAR